MIWEFDGLQKQNNMVVYYFYTKKLSTPVWFSYSSLQSSVNTDNWTLVCYFYADTGFILPSWSVSKLRPAVPCAPANVPPGVLPNPTHTTHASASTAVRSVDFHVLCIIRQRDMQKKKKSFLIYKDINTAICSKWALKRGLCQMLMHIYFLLHINVFLFYFGFQSIDNWKTGF